MPVGAGGCPAGAVPAGYGSVDQAPAPVLVPLPDPITGLSDTGRAIAPQNAAQGAGDYSFTPDGRLVGMPTVNQLVLLAIENLDLSSITEKGANYAARVTALIQGALAPIVAQKLLLVRSISVLPTPNPDGSIAMVYWTDLTKGTPQQTAVTP